MKSRALGILTGILTVATIIAGVLTVRKAIAPGIMRAETPSTQRAVVVSSAGDGEKMVRVLGDEGVWLGVTVSDVNSEKAKELKLSGEYGAIVEDVSDNSPAAKAGLKKGDVILQFAGEKVRSTAEFRRLVHETPAGRSVPIQVWRNGSTQALTATIAEAPEQNWFSEFQMPHVEIPNVHVPDVHVPNFDFNFVIAGGPRLGISGDDLTSQLAGYFGVKEGKGVLVREVKDGTPAQKAGLRAGDVIVKAGDEEVASVNDLRQALAKNPNEKRQVTLTIVRDRKEQTLNVELEPEHQIMGPQEIAQLKSQILNQDQMRQLKDQILAQTEDLRKNSDLMRLQKENIRDEVQRSMEQYRRSMEQFRKDHGQQMEQYRKELQKFRQEQLQQPI
ncbi:MAG TPA: PDZ domain-containing protein [Terriglobia bacterium]|nr:PDZ domain-containing protein [Terriglobia bacterium]